MFNLKSKEKKTPQTFEDTLQQVRESKNLNNPPDKPVATAEQIHEEFNSYGSDVLEEVANWGEDKKHLIKKRERLYKLGFQQTEEIAQADGLVNKNWMFNSIKHFSEHYPLNKFIGYEKVKDVCKKYGLLVVGLKQYKGNVPDKNLEEIENFTLKERDYSGWAGSNEITDERYSSLPDYKKGITTDGKKVEYNYTKPNMVICALPKDIIMGQYDKIEDSVFVVRQDPIILQPVHGGYLVVTAWGEEATEVVNEINN